MQIGERMKEQTVRRLLHTLKQIEQERKARTAELEEAAKVVLKHLADLGHVGTNTKTADTQAKPMATIGKNRRKQRVRRKFTVSGEESVLSFVKEHKGATTQDIKKFWAGEGRGGTADNVLSKLVKEKKLKRTPLDGQRGSRYGVA